MNELKDCTFKPSIRHRGDTSTSRMNSSRDNFFSNLSTARIETRNLVELEKKKEEMELKGCTFTPSISNSNMHRSPTV